MSKNPNITDELVKNNINQDWDFQDIGSNPAITFNMLLSCPHYTKCLFFAGYSKNPKLTIKNITDYFDCEWSIKEISRNPAFTLDMLLELSNKLGPGYDLCNNSLSENPNITLEIMEQHKSIEWDNSSIIQNPNITWNYILQNIDIVNKYQDLILSNKFTYCETVYKRLCSDVIITSPFIIKDISTIICRYIR